jgi:hypothetical protein
VMEWVQQMAVLANQLLLVNHIFPPLYFRCRAAFGSAPALAS